jgi:DNA-binding SARP family transcriptional activator
MGRLSVHLFGRFDAGYEECGECLARPLRGLDARKPQECLSYLLLHRHRMLPREVLAELVAPDMTTEQSRKGLRQVLWQVQSALSSAVASAASPDPSPDDSPGEPVASAQDRFLVVDAEWVYINPHSDLWLDVAQIDETLQGVIGQQGETLSRETDEKIRSAIAVYRGDLIEGW